MMKKNIFSFLLIFLCASLFAELDFSGTLSSKLGFFLPQTENAFDFSEAAETLEGELSYYGENFSLFVDASLSFDALKAFCDEKLDYASGIESFSGKLKEAYFDYSFGFFGIRIGRQMETWGAADSFTVSNVLCPQDYTSLTGADISDSYLGIDAVKVNFSKNAFSLNLYWIPLFTPSSLPLEKGNVLNKVLVPSSVDFGNATIKINSFTDDSLNFPETSLKNGEYALRSSVYTSFADFSLYAFYGWDDFPIIDYVLNLDSENSFDSISLFGSYKRMMMFAFDSSVPVKEVVFRFEGAFFPERCFSVNAENQLLSQGKSGAFEKRNEFTYLLGFDWIKGDLTLTAQYFSDFVFGDVDELSAEPFSHKTSFSVSYSFLGGNLTFSLAGILGLNDFDSVAEFDAKYSLSDQIAFTLSSYFFNEGKDVGEYGAYKDLSSALLKCEFRF